MCWSQKFSSIRAIMCELENAYKYFFGLPCINSLKLFRQQDLFFYNVCSLYFIKYIVIQSEKFQVSCKMQLKLKLRYIFLVKINGQLLINLKQFHLIGYIVHYYKSLVIVCHICIPCCA